VAQRVEHRLKRKSPKVEETREETRCIMIKLAIVSR
jgi:hypothetical protein